MNYIKIYSEVQWNWEDGLAKEQRLEEIEAELLPLENEFYMPPEPTLVSLYFQEIKLKM